MASKSSEVVDIDMKEWEVLLPDDVAFIDLDLFSDQLRFSPREDHFSRLSNVPLILEKKNSDEQVFKDIGVVPPAVIVTAQNAVSVDTTNPDKLEESPKSVESLSKSPPISNNEEEDEKETVYQEEEDEEEGKKHNKAACCGVNIWGWRASGSIGAIGVAAATICIIVLGGRQQRQQQHHPNKSLQFQSYTEDKSIKQVMQQATRLNQALSGVRGIPVTRAHISFGGYYDGL